MKEDKDIIEETFKVPSDILMDILAVIVKEGLKHEVVKVMPHRSQVLICVFYSETTPMIKKIISNIKGLLAEYDDYRSSENDELDWRNI